jgi:TrpR-related protein YerC/YecD
MSQYKSNKGGIKPMKNLTSPSVDFLFDAILSLKSREECYTFFEDICTVNEILSLSQRFEVAAMLRQKKTYLEIAEKTGASTATISRVNRSLIYGEGGYEVVFDRIQELPTDYSREIIETSAAKKDEK